MTSRERSVRFLRWKWANVNAVAGFSAFRRARRMRRQRMTKEEYQRLKQMVPSIATHSRVSKIRVIEETIKYIDTLHMVLFQRLESQESSTGGVPVANETNRNQIRQWIGQLLPLDTARILSQQLQQRERTTEWPSFLEKVDQMEKKKKG